MTFHICFLPSFGSFDKAVTEEKIIRNRPIRNKNCLWWPCFLKNRAEMSTIYRTPSIGTSYQVSVLLAMQFQRRRFFRNRPCLLTNWAEMTNLYIGFSIDPSYQVSVHLAIQFQRRRSFRNRPIRNKNCLWRPCLLMYRTLHRYFLPSFSSCGYGVSEEKIKMWKDYRRTTTMDGRRMSSDGNSSRCLWQGELRKSFKFFPT
jgi:hypothetical protein